MSLLTIVQDALVEVGLSRPAFAIASTDPGVIAMVSMVNQTGKHLMRRHAWQALQTEKTFTSVALASQATASAVPTDFDRFINESFWNRTKIRPVYGPLSPQEWQQRQASPIGGISDYFRMQGNQIYIYPTPTAGWTMAYEYISNYWVSSSKTAMTADSDTGLVDENLLKLGAIWRYLKSRSMDYAEEFRAFEQETETAIAKDGGKSTLRLGGNKRTGTPAAPTAPEGSWSL
jgi:hypothetical protein